jgi:serine beta-lactamase-like protein LACTB
MPYIIINQLYFILLIFPFTAEGQEKFSTKVHLEIETIPETVLEEANIPGLSIAVSKDGQKLYAEGFGYANAEENIIMDSSIRIRTVSVAKVIIATALGQLATEGKLDFDAPIKYYVPYIQPAYAQLTSRQLAGHTLGLKHRPKGQSYKIKQYDNIEETAVLMNAPLLFIPDTNYKYSTHAFNLLAAVIEGASGKKYRDYLIDDIFRPLKMTTTSAENINELTHRDAVLY